MEKLAARLLIARLLIALLLIARCAEFAAVVAAGLAGAFLWKRGDLPGATATVSPGVTMSTPMGQSKDPNDPGEKMFRNGLYPEALAYWTKEAAKGNAQAAHRLANQIHGGGE